MVSSATRAASESSTIWFTLRNVPDQGWRNAIEGRVNNGFVIRAYYPCCFLQARTEILDRFSLLLFSAEQILSRLILYHLGHFITQIKTTFDTVIREILTNLPPDLSPTP